MNLTALRTLAIVVKLGSFSEAGRQLGYTQSAVSQQIAAMERSLGLQLFERKARTIQPTEAARYLHARAEELMGMLERVEQDVARLSAGQAGRIRIGFFLSAGTNLLPEALARFLVRRREVQVTLIEGEPDEVLLKTMRGELDVALVFRYDGIPAKWPADLHVVSLMTDPMYVIASRGHRLAGDDDVRLLDLADEPWVSTSERTDGHEFLVRTTANAGFQPNFAFTVDDFDAIQGLVRSSLGIAMLPKLAYVASSDVIRLPVNGLPQRHIAAVTRSIEHSPLVSGFIVAVRDIAAKFAARDPSQEH